METNDTKVTGNVVNAQSGGGKLFKDVNTVLLVATEAKAVRSRPRASAANVYEQDCQQGNELAVALIPEASIAEDKT